MPTPKHDADPHIIRGSIKNIENRLFAVSCEACVRPYGVQWAQSFSMNEKGALKRARISLKLHIQRAHGYPAQITEKLTP